MTFRNCVAVDLGASSGRVMLARYERECRSLTLREIHRFNNGLHSQNGYVTWNVDSLESAIRLGLNKVGWKTSWPSAITSMILVCWKPLVQAWRWATPMTQ